MRYADEDAVGFIYPVKADVGVVDRVIVAKGNGRVADRGEFLEHALRIARAAQSRQLLVDPGRAAIHRHIHPAAAIVAQRSGRNHAAIPIIVCARHQVQRVGRVDGQRGFVLRRAATVVHTSTHVDVVSVNHIDVGDKWEIRILIRRVVVGRALRQHIAVAQLEAGDTAVFVERIADRRLRLGASIGCCQRRRCSEGEYHRCGCQGNSDFHLFLQS